jgi:cytochrome b pre-mRNA-processing protein 3
MNAGLAFALFVSELSPMSLFKRLFGDNEPHPREAMRDLYNQVVARARELHWYEKGQVPDSVDGRFDMLAAILALVLIRLEDDPALAQDSVYLTEIFVNDMDGQLREIGIGDMVVGKHIGRMMSSLGGRIGAFRGDGQDMDDAIIRNIYRGAAPDVEALAHVRETLLANKASIAMLAPTALASGNRSW